jgi:hypothetical protein
MTCLKLPPPPVAEADLPGGFVTCHLTWSQVLDPLSPSSGAGSGETGVPSPILAPAKQEEDI